MKRPHSLSTKQLTSEVQVQKDRFLSWESLNSLFFRQRPDSFHNNVLFHHMISVQIFVDPAVRKMTSFN